MIRVDSFPTHELKGFKVRAGKPLPFGASIAPGGINFSVFSKEAASCTLVLFKKGQQEPMAEIEFPREFKIGNVYAMVVFGLDCEETEYGYRMDGPFDIKKGLWFDRTRILMDPYAKNISGRDVWGVEPDHDDPYPHRAKILYDDFDWEDDRALEIPIEELVIYEIHVRGFTRHESAKVKYPGTFAGLREKIDYLKTLGINCLELMPIHEFDEFENSRISPVTGERLMNYWGYSNIGFFAPKAGYAVSGKYGMQADELKATIKMLHKAGIEVILDVVFNHTAEGNEKGPYISYRGLDNRTYYMLTPEGYYYNFSGCGNTLNCNNPIVRNIILDCLRYWVAEYHIDGFRFDLASILGRNFLGEPMANPPLLEILAHDPILARCKLIAEAWDAGGVYQVGSFPAFGRWVEWNGKYRDDVRRFLKGDFGMAQAMKQRLEGSPDLYSHKGSGTTASVNFITCHDGFTLMDLVSYNEKHNLANGEENRDGSNENFSWNCGWEGETHDPSILILRKKQIKNALCILLISQGIPMILAGDEMGNTQFGNNNAYCQDNDISWINWDNLKKYHEIYHFTQKMIAFRKAHPCLRNPTHFQYKDSIGSGFPDISWFGRDGREESSPREDQCMACLLCEKHSGTKTGLSTGGLLYMALNSHHEMHGFRLPGLNDDMNWHVAVNTDAGAGQDIWEPGEEPLLVDQREILVGPRSIIILIGRNIISAQVIR